MQAIDGLTTPALSRNRDFNSKTAARQKCSCSFANLPPSCTLASLEGRFRASDLNDLPASKRLQLDSPSTLSNSLYSRKYLTHNQLRPFLGIFKCPESPIMPSWG